MTKHKNKQKWLDEHFSDEYVKKAQQMGLRSRAVFKLEEIDKKDKLLEPNQVVVDLGAAPGGWSEYAIKKVTGKGRVIALDLLDIEPINGVDFIKGDFSDDAVFERLQQLMDNRPIDIVLSDIAPNMSGSKAIDQPKSMYLAELALDFAKNGLSNKGVFLIKLFQGEGFDQFVTDAKKAFLSVVIRKPKASRARSREVYLLAKGLKL
ncbi:MAG: 23S rRNA (uridine(2552)-2'-O)-methyltransferase RlmE [Cycloclasticus sp.]|nr:23S rRNA (uridine(2552)-2'-O)-methyltransferase RlmE [Cycloclasticus sp.]MBG97357.1 23S rRNA (uridine(2552)-2'-O)-methyltransferase RlmE [Cycloclasticus sp.]